MIGLDVALTAAMAMLEAGHCKGCSEVHMREGSVAYSLDGAVKTATITLGGIALWNQARAAVTAQLPAGFDRLPQYNDHEATTADMVIDLLAKTIEEIRA